MPVSGVLRFAVHKAIYYAASLARLETDSLFRKLEGGLGKVGDPKTLTPRVRELLADEGEAREIALMLVSTGIHPGLERVTEFLERFSVPIDVVSFEVFELEGSPQLLIREVVDEHLKPPRPKRKLTVEAIRARAADVGVGEQFDRFVEMSEQASLAAQPQRSSVRIAPPSDRRRFLIYASPSVREGGGGLWIFVGPKRFTEWSPKFGEEQTIAALDKYGEGGHLGGVELTERLDRY